MNYTSTVTSKGTITIPASIRHKFGITEGSSVSFSVHGDTIVVRPQGSWDEVMAVGDDIRAYLKSTGVENVDIAQLRADADAIKAAEYREKYLGPDNA